MGKRKDELARLSEIRARIEATRERIEEVENAPIPLDEARSQVRRWIQSAGELVDIPGIAYFGRSGFVGPLSLVHLTDRSTNPALERAGLTRSPSDDLTSLLCALAPDALENMICNELEKHLAQCPVVLPTAECAGRLARLQAELIELEISEEAIIRKLEDGGAEVPRRADARPQVVLAADLERLREAA